MRRTPDRVATWLDWCGGWMDACLYFETSGNGLTAPKTFTAVFENDQYGDKDWQYGVRNVHCYIL